MQIDRTVKIIGAIAVGAALIVGILIGSLISTATAKDDSEAVASVNGEKISRNEFYEFLVDQNGLRLLDTLITNKIIDQEINKNGISIMEEEIEKELNEIYAYYGGQEAILQELEASGMGLEDLREDIIINIKIRKLLELRIEASEDELEKYFQDNKASFEKGEQIKASHILVKEEKEAYEIISKINSGEDFSDLAKEFSLDDSNSQSGGDLGYFGKGAMVPEFENAAFALEIGELSAPVKTIYGYHIIRLEDKKTVQDNNYEDNKEQVKTAYMEEKMQSEYAIWLDEKFTEYDIEKYLEKK